MKLTNTIGKGLIILSLFLWAICAHAQTVNQTIVNSPGAIQSAGNADTGTILPIPYDTCPVGFRCEVIKWRPCCDSKGELKPLEPIYFVRADGSKIVQYMIVGIAPKPKKRQHRRRYDHAQQPKPDPKPTEFKLNPDASKVWTNIDQAESDLQRQWAILEGQRAALLIGAGVPADSRQCKADDKGVVVCVKPQTAVQPSPK